MYSFRLPMEHHINISFTFFVSTLLSFLAHQFKRDFLRSKISARKQIYGKPIIVNI